MGSNPCRKISLLSIDHPIVGSSFQVQGVFGKTTLIRGRFREESRHVALIYFVKQLLEFLILIYVRIKSDVITLETMVI